ncbi:hypothetical protein CORC01_05515 [Colletotrichum orchidophilum]|uniref:Myb-like DNA-binding domain-containing protein n=1 Tax=Colletotrichum orchidophilum TaxID=1209926 RepID=A0A1G4BCV9_9PEZI|nr:uncharacterized protein CORC01_05515 [Colletotrichum orchidophilum]OHE99234.1 hypothetical protein CORC01_05515 [Colletotrichum orchidophilum]
MASVGTDAEGQVTFLVYCIKHSTGGKVDFQSVADDCNIVTKAAAAKRFERVLQKYGLKTSDLAKAGPMAASPGGSTASPKTPSKSAAKVTPKSKGKRAAADTPTKETKRSKLANHPAVSSYNDDDDAEEENQFKVKSDPEASVADSTNGSYYNVPRGRDDDDDDLQLLYVVEKTSDCPVHDSGESRSPPSASVSSDTNTDISMQMLPRATSNPRFSDMPACYHGWGFLPDIPVYTWPDTCAIHGELEAAQTEDRPLTLTMWLSWLTKLLERMARTWEWE